MRILQKVTQAEMNTYRRQPTAKQLQERIRRDGVYIPAGDKAAAAAYVAGRQGDTSAMAAMDRADISAAARALQEKAAGPAQAVQAEDSMDWLNITPNDEGKYTAKFTSSAQIAAVLKRGYLLVEGQKVLLDKQQQKDLAAAGRQMEKDQQQVANTMMLEQQLASASQQSDAWKKNAQQQSRILATAMRMMKGRQVSRTDEKELAEGAPDLYKLAKSAGSLEKIRESQQEKQESQRISEANERQRAAEDEPKDYSTPPRSAYPTYETQVSIEMSGGEPQIVDAREVTIPPADGSGTISV
ncbi:MAG: hypothetical protein K6F95_01375 [Selenomonas sp.]|uniref:hypothetical protein n=1 Tax=Selenomonas sp. TaxID=2053611 RepID=UPI0025E3B90F|nr:hypothetical protein [Selenomonas sp.]MCR5756543.1 hypothetical protein [Selenomonas sp.]